MNARRLKIASKSLLQIDYWIDYLQLEVALFENQCHYEIDHQDL